MAGEPDLIELHRRQTVRIYVLYGAAILAIVLVGGFLESEDRARSERNDDRIIRVERPSDATLKREIARTLLVCSRDPDCRRRFVPSALRGRPGSAGRVGASGADGRSVTGAVGPVGRVGRAGEPGRARRGAPGGRGATGGPGVAGPRGERGESREGPSGPPGPPGEPGRDGEDGRDGRDDARERVDDVLDHLPLP